MTLSKLQKGQNGEGTLSLDKVVVLLSEGSVGLTGIAALSAVFFSFMVVNGALISHHARQMPTP